MQIADALHAVVTVLNSHRVLDAGRGLGFDCVVSARLLDFALKDSLIARLREFWVLLVLGAGLRTFVEQWAFLVDVRIVDGRQGLV